ncbi:MAG TPA: DEAD/DEAH box helicase, partial [Nakamurella sp.]
MRAPADAYSASRRRAAHPELTAFDAVVPFELDPFQRTACEALEAGHGVLVCAPTGAGKTVVGEFAVHLALSEGRKCFYTTPIKALSNQKFADLTARHGAANVGLLTGDTSINGDAPVVVMTTEVLRNMLYAGSSTLEGLGYVVMDEVHYLADRFRGAVWEEVILHLSESVRVVGLSATVSNAEEFGEWLVEVRGDTTVVVDEHRPVPLWQHMMVSGRLMDLFADEAAPGHTTGQLAMNPNLLRRTEDLSRLQWQRGRGRDAGGRGPRFRPTSRVEVVERLETAQLLPAIVFVFSRAGCAAAVEQCVRAGLRLTSEDEVTAIRAIIDRRTSGLPDADLRVLGYWEWREALERGIAGHHAGMLPAFKETVEELFVNGLVKAVFATETLALGINMPARTVVLERLVKYNGEAHVDLTPGEYTQLTGRAGRRGIDVEGHAVVLWQPGVDPKQVAGLASTRTYPLRSSFRPGYNMAVNLVHQLGAEAARDLLEQSFAQFQADRSVVGLARRIEHNERALAGYAESMACHLGDFTEYAALRRKVADREKHLARQNTASRRAESAASLERLRKGDVIAVPSGRRPGLAVVIDPGLDPLTEPRPLVVTEDRWAGRLSVTDFPTPVQTLGRIRLPKQVDVRSPRSRRDLAESLRNAGITAPGRERRRSTAADDAELATLRRALRAHPCHGCEKVEEHARWGERYHQLAAENARLTQKMAATTHSLARAFDRIRNLLAERGYLTPPDIEGEPQDVTEHGRRLARLYSESDLLAAECVRHGVWRDLEPAELAAVVSALV